MELGKGLQVAPILKYNGLVGVNPVRGWEEFQQREQDEQRLSSDRYFDVLQDL